MLNDKIFVTPLGGCGEIGKNMMVIESSTDAIVIDAGLMFPEDEMLGVDLIIPDTTYLVKRMDKIRGIFITHGHEDHIGALPYLLPQFKVPIYGTRLTLGLIKSKLEEHDLKQVEMHCVKPRDRIELGPFTIEFFRVSHSIVDGVGIAVHTPVGVIVHTGDFKFDHTPIDGETTDFHKLAELGNNGVLLLMSDSTNVEKPGFSLSEMEVGKVLNQIFSGAKGRIIVTTFASNLHRIKQVMDTAKIYRRKVCILGMSMINVITMAREMGYLDIVEERIVPIEKLNNTPLKRLVLITTGSQGEPMSALSRMALDSHKHVKVCPGDTVVISARVIPGNEVSISRAINNLFRLGAEVVYEEVSEVHVSGHASVEELKLMINLVKPKFFVPIHGEYRHLVHHRQLAIKLNIPKENTFILENGMKLELMSDKARILGKVESGLVLVDGKGVGDVGRVVLRDRQHLAQDGMVIVVVTIDKQNGKLLAGPDLISRGFVYTREADELMLEAKARVKEVMEECAAMSPTDWATIKGNVRATLGKFFYEAIERRPMILPIVMEV
jgi:ribonuclease J